MEDITFKVDNFNRTNMLKIERFKGTNRTLQFTEDDINNLLYSKYGQGDTLVILSILYPWADLKDTIARIVRNALRIQEKHRLGVSRKRELDYLGKWFFSLEDINDSHRLAAHVFGLYRCRHFQGVDERGTDNADVSMWQAGPNIRELRSRSRKRLRDTGTGSIRDRRERQRQAKEKFLSTQQEEMAVLQAYLARREIRIADLDPVSAGERYYLLYWIGRCMANKSRRLESTLQQAGLLDAWVSPEGIGVLGVDEEETWVFKNFLAQSAKNTNRWAA